MDRKTLHSQLNFETLAKLFFDLTDERYPSAEKIKQLASRLVSSLTTNPLELLHLQIAVLGVMRNMIREVSPGQLYRSLQHRDELYVAIIEALEDLEDELQDLEEKEEEEHEKTEEIK
jgi:RNA processing factor Prp31